MGRLIVIEGLDGAGKRTFADGVEKALLDDGAKVRRLSFPRYGQSHAADLVQEALYGRIGDLSDSVYGMAVLYALDRHQARKELVDLQRAHDIVLLDRYVASNAAYGAARLHQSAGGEFVEWVLNLEIGRFGLPRPDEQLLLRVPGEVAAERARQRAVEEVDRERDDFESDDDLQNRVAAVYDDLAASQWLAPWRVVDGVTGTDHAAIAALAKALLR